MAKSSRDAALALKADLIDEVFELAKGEILSLDGDKYTQLMSSLLSKVIRDRAESEQDSLRLYGEDISPERYEVQFNKSDREKYGASIISGARRAVVEKVSAAMLDRVVLADNYVNIDGGFVVKCGDVELNCSIDTIICELRPELEARIADILFVQEENKQD